MVIYTGPSQEELKNPRMEDIDLTNALIEHLNDHLEYYHKWIWLSLTDQRRFMILDGIILNNPKAEGKSLASLVVNELIGIVGNSLVFPVSPGLNIDPRFSLTDSLLEYYMVTGSEPSTVSVPTEGVFAEAMMGSCNSCEKIDDSRFWRWEESPIPDSPTSIGEVSTDSRRSDPGNLAANPFANPVINIQNAPSVSDPSGVGGTLSLLGKSDSFRDATGLAGNQQNALSALQASYQATQSISQAAAGLEGKRLEEATKIEQAKIMERRLDKAIGTINTSKVLTDGQKQQLIEQAVSGYLGGGSSPKPAAVPDVAARIQQAQKVSTAVGNLVANKQISQETADAINKSTWQKAAFESSAQMTTIPVERMQDLLSSSGNATPGSSMEYRKGDEALSISTGKPTTVDPGSSTNGGTSGGQGGQGGTAQVTQRITVILKPLVPILEHSIDPAIDSVKRRNLISAADPLLNPMYLKAFNSQAFETAINSILPLGQQSDIAITVYDLSTGAPLELCSLNPKLAYSPQFMSNIAGVIGLMQLTKDVEIFHSPYIGQMSFDKTIESYRSWLEFKGIPTCDQPYLEDIYSGVTTGGSFALRQEVMDSLRGLNTADSIGILSSTLLGYFYTGSVLLSYDLVDYFVSSSPRAINNSIAEGMWQKEMLPNAVAHLGKTLTRGTWKAHDPFDLYFTGGNGFVNASSLTNLFLNLILGRFADAGHSSFVNAFLDVNSGGFLNPNITIPANWIGSEISALSDLSTASHDVVHFKNTALSKEFVAVVLAPHGNSNLVNSIFQTIFANV